MPIRVTMKDDLVRPRRNKASVIDSLEEFQQLKMKLADGLKPQQAIEISFPASQERGRRYLKQTLKRRVIKMLKTMQLPYAVETWSAGGMEYLAVIHDVPVVTASPPKSSHRR